MSYVSPEDGVVLTPQCALSTTTHMCVCAPRLFLIRPSRLSIARAASFQHWSATYGLRSSAIVDIVPLRARHI